MEPLRARVPEGRELSVLVHARRAASNQETSHGSSFAFSHLGFPAPSAFLPGGTLSLSPLLSVCLVVTCISALPCCQLSFSFPTESSPMGLLASHNEDRSLCPVPGSFSSAHFSALWYSGPHFLLGMVLAVPTPLDSHITNLSLASHFWDSPVNARISKRSALVPDLPCSLHAHINTLSCGHSP